MGKKKKHQFVCLKCGSPLQIYRKGKKHRLLFCPQCGLLAQNPGISFLPEIPPASIAAFLHKELFDLSPMYNIIKLGLGKERADALITELTQNLKKNPITNEFANLTLPQKYLENSPKPAAINPPAAISKDSVPPVSTRKHHEKRVTPSDGSGVNPYVRAVIPEVAW